MVSILSPLIGLSALAIAGHAPPHTAETGVDIGDFRFEHHTESDPTIIAGLIAPHSHEDAGYRPIASAIVGGEPQFYAPADAVGKAGFKLENQTLVHGNSGLKCANAHVLRRNETGDVALAVSLVRVSAFDPSGRDVACAYLDQARSVLVTVFASEWPTISLDEHFSQATQLMVTQETPFAAQIDIPVMAPSEAALPMVDGEAMAVAYDGQPSAEGVVKREALWMTKVRGWHVKVRVTHVPPANPPLVLGMFIHASGVENVALDRGALSNRLVNDVDGTEPLARTVSWVRP